MRGEAFRGRALRKLLPLFLDDVVESLPAPLNAAHGLRCAEIGDPNSRGFQSVLYERAIEIATRASPVVDMGSIELAIGPANHWFQSDQVRSFSADLSLSIRHARAIIDWLLNHSPNHLDLRRAGVSLFDFQRALGQRRVDYEAAGFDSVEQFSSVCCHETPFALFERKDRDGDLVIAHVSQMLKNPLLGNVQRAVSVHHREYYASLLRRSDPKIHWFRRQDFLDVFQYFLSLKLELAPLDAQKVSEDCFRHFEPRFRPGHIRSMIFTLRNIGVLQHEARGRGPMNGVMSIPGRILPITAVATLRSTAQEKILQSLGMISVAELDRLMEHEGILELRPAA
ncbi:MAG: hypothetical protein AAFW46_18450 [Pseudomonadota bacterium]